LTANQNPSCFKELNHLKWQTRKLQHMLVIDRMISSAGVDAYLYRYLCSFRSWCDLAFI